ncbi:hypothetical protein COB21_03085, partial [Candidatus Aerophobetes bacterium]
MSDDNRIKINPIPQDKYKIDKEDDVKDSKKFKKIMEVDPADDSQKKHKRALNEDEHDEDEVVDGSTQNPDADLFASILNPEETTSLFDPKSKGVRNIDVSEGAPQTSFADEEGSSDPVSTPEDQAEQAPLSAGSLGNSEDSNDNFNFDSVDSFSEINLEPDSSIDQGNSSANSPENQNSDNTQTDNTPQTNVTRKKSAENNQQEPVKDKKSVKKQTKVAATKSVKTALPTKEAKNLKQNDALDDTKLEPDQIDKPNKDSIEKKSPSFTPSKASDTADALLKHISGSNDKEKEGDKKDQSQEKQSSDDKVTPTFPHAGLDNAGIAPEPIIEATYDAGPLESLPVTSKLSPQAYQLFEQMAGIISVVKDSDVTTTSVTINIEGSVFDGAEVVFNQYKSAPLSYNLELKGTPQAVDLFTKNIPLLEASFKQGGFKFAVNILPPSLSQKNSSKRVQRKSGSDDKRDKK